MFDIRKMQEQAILKNVEEESDEKTANMVVYGENAETKDQNDDVWVNSTMKRLENTFTVKQVKKIRMKCQCGFGMDEKIDLVKELLNEASNLEELCNLPKAKMAGLLYKNGELYLQFLECPCPMLKNVNKLESKTWCECTTGYSKVLFEKAFSCHVDVELCKSIKAGDDICLMKIIPQHNPFNS